MNCKPLFERINVAKKRIDSLNRDILLMEERIYLPCNPEEYDPEFWKNVKDNFNCMRNIILDLEEEFETVEIKIKDKEAQKST